VAVVADTVDMLAKVHDVLDRLERVEGAVWVVQFYLVQEQRTASKESGLDLVLDAELGAAVNQDVSATVYSLDARATFKRHLTNGDTRIQAEPLFVLLDGTEGVIKVGERVPVPKKTVSPEGTVETVGFDQEEIGLEVRTVVREGAGATATLSYSVALGEITGYVETSPITSQQSLEGQTLVRPGGTYLLGRLERLRSNVESSGLFGAEMRRSREETGTLHLWAVVERVEGAVISGRG